MNKRTLQIIKEIAGFSGGAIAIAATIFTAGEAHKTSNDMKEFVKKTALHADSLAIIHDHKIDLVIDSISKANLNTRKIWRAFENHVNTTKKDKQEIIDMLTFKPDFSRNEKKKSCPTQFYSLNQKNNGK
jgi:hypothetical protein